jgi:hypothetical protein
MGSPEKTLTVDRPRRYRRLGHRPHAATPHCSNGDAIDRLIVILTKL